jgi:hypothetical protein
MPEIEIDSAQSSRLKEFRPVTAVILAAQQQFRNLLLAAKDSGGVTRERYVRYLSMQFHLTREVQRPFMAIAAHPALARRKRLRDFLYAFAIEEEPHFAVAADDLANLGEIPLPIPFDTELWWAYFNGTIGTRPFVRLGAACVLENLGPGAGALGRKMLAAAAFLNKLNTRFLEIHFHEALPHGDQIIQAMTSVPLSAAEIGDCREGAIKGATMYLRMAAWVFKADPLMEALAVA